MAVLRGCGYRVKGGVYLEVKLTPGGSPIENFIMDPPQAIDPDAMGLSEIGMKVIYDPQGTPHLLDWVGESNYPNVQDFIAETRRHGVSRRVSSRMDLSVLTPASRLLLVHRKAIIRNADDYWRDNVGYISGARCASDAKGGPNHISLADFNLSLRAKGGDSDLPPPMCNVLWTQDIVGGIIPETGPAFPQDVRHVLRTIGDTTYHGRRSPDEPTSYAAGIFLALPISNFAVINNPDDPDKVSKLFEQIQSVLSGMDVFLEDQ